jgi:hypothetical protein
MKCDVHNCYKPREHGRRFWCIMHRKRWERHGDFDKVHKCGPKRKVKSDKVGYVGIATDAGGAILA